MKSCLFILIFHLVLAVQYATPLTFKEWYEKYVRNCTAGSTFKSYKADTVCTCLSPGVIDMCRYEGMRESSLVSFRLAASNPRVRVGKGSKHLCSKSKKPFFDGCNWCECKKGAKYAACTNLPCVKQSKKDAENGVQGKTDFNAPGPSKCKAARYKHEDGCNWCTCTNGWALCTAMSCRNNKALVGEAKFPCKGNPQRQFLDDDGCNSCYCMDENTPICTRKYCNKKSKLKPNKKLSNTCEGKPSRFMADDGCNWCYCIGTIPMCTIMLCLEPKVTLSRTLSASICKNRRGRIQPDECNECYCGDRGIATCSLHQCSPKNGELDNTEKRGPGNAMLKEVKHKSMKLYALKEKAQGCKTGEKFKEPYDCNWCSCVEHGVVVCDTNTCR